MRLAQLNRGIRTRREDEDLLVLGETKQDETGLIRRRRRGVVTGKARRRGDKKVKGRDDRPAARQSDFPNGSEPAPRDSLESA
ncbi:hypothetical protein E2C01_017703 [Portunus trituberculatus]|uniref:Uncharacterized protein n=1 Tax=Portunus trituberculatus TaxID=210409 RepID=A0A5B7DTL8_PORTR|nr:hypothetical protein [Portunus trituberculatus]